VACIGSGSRFRPDGPTQTETARRIAGDVRAEPPAPSQAPAGSAAAAPPADASGLGREPRGIQTWTGEAGTVRATSTGTVRGGMRALRAVTDRTAKHPWSCARLAQTAAPPPSRERRVGPLPPATGRCLLPSDEPPDGSATQDHSGRDRGRRYALDLELASGPERIRRPDRLPGGEPGCELGSEVS